jgi:hypothetical protein
MPKLGELLRRIKKGEDQKMSRPRRKKSLPAAGSAELYDHLLEHPEDWSLYEKAQGERENEKKDYKVGRGRPPIASRYKPGQSGNPLGRPKGSKNLRKAFEEILTDKVTIREGNKRRRITRLEAVFRVCTEQAIKGNHRAIRTVCETATTFGLLDERPLTLDLDNMLLKNLSLQEMLEFRRLLAKVNGSFVYAS